MFLAKKTSDRNGNTHYKFFSIDYLETQLRTKFNDLIEILNNFWKDDWINRIWSKFKVTLNITYKFSIKRTHVQMSVRNFQQILPSLVDVDYIHYWLLDKGLCRVSMQIETSPMYRNAWKLITNTFEFFFVNAILSDLKVAEFPKLALIHGILLSLLI